ncbi:MAG: transglutaminase N-terminal domain-containing protein, partial [Alphaproteobacteria bacterium]
KTQNRRIQDQMSKAKKLRHKLSFNYDQPTEVDSLVLSLAPLPTHSDQLISHTIEVQPEPSNLSWVENKDGLRAVLLTYDEPIEHWTLTNNLMIRNLNQTSNGFTGLSSYAEHFPFPYDGQLSTDLKPFCGQPDADANLIDVLKSLPTKPLPTIEAMELINTKVLDCLEIDQDEDDLQQEHCLLLSNTLRAVNMATRFATGYDISNNGCLTTLCQTYLPGVGWTTVKNSGLDDAKEFIALKVATDFESASLTSSPISSPISSLGQTDSVLLESLRDPNHVPETGPTAAALKSEGMASAATHIDMLLANADFNVSSFIQTNANEAQTDATNATWQDIIEDLNKRLDANATPSSGRLHNFHTLTGSKAAQIAGQARFLSLAFPCLTRLVGAERFEGAHLTARDEALHVPKASNTDTFKARHDLVEPFQTLPNALLERGILARLAKGDNPRFSPRSDTLLADVYRLPSLLWEDLQVLCGWLAAEQINIDPSWFSTHMAKRFPLAHQLDIKTTTDDAAQLLMRPAFRSQAEKHQFNLFEFKLDHDDQDRFDVGVNGWVLPFKRCQTGKVAAVKFNHLYETCEVTVYDKWQRETLLSTRFRVSGDKLTPDSTPFDKRRLVSPPPHPELNHTLDLAYAEHWGGTGRRF